MSATTASELRSAASAFVDALDDEQRGIACLAFDEEEERRTWFYWPSERRGLPFAQMSADQRALAHRVLASAVGLPAYAKATAIVALEEVLGQLEQTGQSTRRGRHGLSPRDSTRYYTTLFGDPAGAGPWGWRFEGHHVSVHATVVDGDVAVVPLFLGANPAHLSHSGRTILRPLGEEEDLARELVHALPSAVRDRAVLTDEAPDDILTTNAPMLEDVPDEGVPLRDLAGDAREMASALVALYLDRLPADVCEEEWRRLDAGVLGELRFAWCGSVEPGGPHYYRLVGPRFLVEYDNTQNDANHVHTVWRDPEGDFGDDLLRRHLAEEHEGRDGDSSRDDHRR